MNRLQLRCSLFTVFAFLIISFTTNAQTITSKSTGGSWADANTWVGGVVPGQNNDVVIEGIVSVPGSAACRNITINDTLDAVSWPAANLTVTGNITNYGLIKDYEAYYWNTLSITVRGGLSNNGIMRNGRTYFAGTAPHTLSLGAGKIFETVFASVDTLGAFTALSPLHFKGAFNLKGAALNMQTYALTLEGAGNISNGTVTNVGDVKGKGGVCLNNITYKGTMTLRSVVTMGAGVTFEGTLTNADTLEAVSWPAASFTMIGNIVNNGLIRDFEGYYWNTLSMYITGNLTNNGILRNGRTYFKGTADHKLSLGADKVFQTKFAATDTLASFTALTPLRFKDVFELKGGTFNMQAKALTLDGAGNLANGSVTNTADLMCVGGATLSSIRYSGMINLKSIVTVSTNVVL
jgi:hypothetical protein